MGSDRGVDVRSIGLRRPAIGYRCGEGWSNPTGDYRRSVSMYIGGGLLVTVLVVLAIIYLAKRV